MPQENQTEKYLIPPDMVNTAYREFRAQNILKRVIES